MRLLAPLAVALTFASSSASGQCLDQAFIPSDNGSHENFGARVAVDGDWAAVSYDTPDVAGVRVYERLADDWVLHQVLELHTPHPAVALALSGDTLAVSANGLRIFQRIGNAWQLTQEWFGSDLPQSGLGVNVGKLALDEHRLVRTGEPTLVFERQGGEWTPVDRIPDPTPAESQFGSAVALDGNHLFLRDVDPGASPLFKNTRILVYEKEGHEWRLADAIANPKPEQLDSFGTDLAVDEGRLFIGSPSALENRGVVYVAESIGSDWRIVDSVVGRVPSGHFGRRLDASAGRVIVAAPLEAADLGLGRAYWLDRDAAGSWELGEALDPLPLGSPVEFGNAVSLHGGDLWIGAAGGGDYPQGVAYSFGPGDCEALVETAPPPVVAWDGVSSEVETWWEGEALWGVEDVQQTAGSPLQFDWTLETDARIRIAIATPAPTGAATFEFTSASTSSSADLEVTNVSPPILLLGDGDFYSGIPLDLEAYAAPGATALLFGSTSPEPSVLPGVLSLDLGAQFTNLVLAKSWTVPDVGTGGFEVTFAGDGSLKLLPVFLQLALVASGQPYAVSDSVYGLWLY